jgi:hypothetical protein
MPPGLLPIDPPTDRAGACRAFAVIENGQRIGVVVLVLAQRPTGGTLRRYWWATPPTDDPQPLPRPFDTRGAAVQALRYRHGTRHRPEPLEPVDATLGTVQAAYDNAGPTAAVWLAASLTIHHLVELDSNRTANPPSLWRELRRVVAWLQTATGHQPDRSCDAAVTYRRTW